MEEGGNEENWELLKNKYPLLKLVKYDQAFNARESPFSWNKIWTEHKNSELFIL